MSLFLTSGEDTCYSLAFGVPAILMAVATVIFVLGKPLYVVKEPAENILMKVVGLIGVSWVYEVQIDQ